MEGASGFRKKQLHQQLMIIYIHGLIEITLERSINSMQILVPLINVLPEEVHQQGKRIISIEV